MNWLTDNRAALIVLVVIVVMVTWHAPTDQQIVQIIDTIAGGLLVFLTRGGRAADTSGPPAPAPNPNP